MNILPADKFDPLEPKPGIYADVPNEIYHKSAGYSKTTLHLIHKSSALAVWNRKAPREPSEAAEVGTAVHTLLLEPDEFDKRYLIMPEGMTLRSKAGQAELERLQAIAKKTGQDVLMFDDAEKAKTMSKSLLAHPDADALLNHPGHSELTYVWIDSDTGLLCKCRADRKPTLPGITVDVKTIDRIDRIDHTFLTLGYHMQDAFYSDGIEQCTGEPNDAFIFLFVAKTREMGRYPVRVVTATADMVEAGRHSYKQALSKVLECEAKNNWGHVETLNLNHKLRWMNGND